MTRQDMRDLYEKHHSWDYILFHATRSGVRMNDALSMMAWEFSLDDDTLNDLRQRHIAEMWESLTDAERKEFTEAFRQGFAEQIRGQ